MRAAGWDDSTHSTSHAVGASVVVNDLGTTMMGAGSDSGIADAVVTEIEAAGGVAVASSHSVASQEGGAAIVKTAVDAFGRLDAVVSNAGIFHTVAFEDLETDDWQRMVDVHLNGSFFLSQPAFREMKSRGYGRFVFIASSAGLFGQPNSAHYAAAKAGIVGLANVLAIEGAPHGILTNCVLPFGSSRMVTETVGDPAESGDAIPFLDAIDPELVVPVVSYLASRRCTFTHRCYSACAGRFSRVFVAQGRGWLAAAGSEPRAEDFEANITDASATEPFTVPDSIFDEIAETCVHLGIPL